MKSIEEQAKQFLDKKGFTVQQQLGQGSFGRVYKAFNFNQNQVVAIKAILPCIGNDVSEQFQKTFQEFQNCMKLKSQYIVKVEDVLVDFDNKLLFIVQEYCSNGSLTEYIKKLEKTENILKQIFIQILKGVIAIHEQKIIHSDLKPDNILVDKNRVIKIADFGEAKQLRQEKGHTHTQGQGCTPFFAAPEVNFNNQISKESDYYSVGAIFCLLCDLSLQDMLGIQAGKFPKITNHKYKNLLILAFNMMKYEPKQRACCQAVLNLLQDLDGSNKGEVIKKIEQMGTEFNEETLSLLNNNNKLQSQQTQSELQLPKREKTFFEKFILLFQVIQSIVPLGLTGISIYYITQINLIYSLLLLITCAKLLLSFPCDDLHICTSDFDVGLWSQQLNDTSSSSQLLNFCSQEEPQRRENIQNYFQSKYNQSMSIKYYEDSQGFLPYFYLSGPGVFFLLLLFRLLRWACCCCSKK
ncbi:Serine/Threonine kinase domain protein (macronuclear) [Tetrahymena thermophila SB210]|uniref:Serine/Threonine kinase domain protein n=1 Tax=Tetrahymena thermophila (strain SB210) TaxID=312017 RepID=Q23MB4_TETTS|nr:Serine/Threonine kinase domain protein [Tetrahymena thermophila SB210]EAR97725.2 Serine/Threonine kinase domain protein [Tetrahymena thermophila SB210]|eukprot:XP_001017970.2 Serine/Threonine kinase domain protein [Tetrahymena thermophila SB210]